MFNIVGKRMKRTIYADNAATTKLDIDAYNAMTSYLLSAYGNASQPYSFAREPKSALSEARQIIASAINALPDEIYFTSGGTESDNWALKGVMLNGKDDSCLLTSAIEHHAILHSAASVERLGYPIMILPVDSTGTVTSDILETSISGKTKLVSIMFSNNEIGTIQPIKELAMLAHQRGALFHTDAVQAVGHASIDVKDLGIDMLSASAHKFNGPKGIGFLYIKKGTPILPFMDGGAQENGMRAGTENIASIVGMAVALEKNCKEIANNQHHLLRLESELIDGLRSNQLDFIRNGATNHIPGNVSLSFKAVDGEMLLHRLDLMGIHVSTGSACDSKNTQISHVLRAIEVDPKYAKGTIRVSFGKDNTSEEARVIVAALTKIIKG